MHSRKVLKRPTSLFLLVLLGCPSLFHTLSYSGNGDTDRPRTWRLDRPPKCSLGDPPHQGVSTQDLPPLLSSMWSGELQGPRVSPQRPGLLHGQPGSGVCLPFYYLYIWSTSLASLLTLTWLTGSLFSAICQQRAEGRVSEAKPYPNF